eukprot:1195676-Prorocentrum_minimum.AAC.2
MRPGWSHRLSLHKSIKGFTLRLLNCSVASAYTLFRHPVCKLELAHASNVGQGRTYTPTSDDIGHTLKFEVSPSDSQRNVEDSPTTVVTGRVIPPPNPPARNLLPVDGSPANSHPSSFTVMTYNVLADLYATVRKPLFV